MGFYQLVRALIPIIAPRQPRCLVEIFGQFNNLGIVFHASVAMRWSIKHALRFETGSTNGNLVYKWQRLVALNLYITAESSPLMPIADAPTFKPKAQATTIWPAS